MNLRELTKSLPRKSEGRIVLVGGCFDILHIGHVRFLSEAKGMGNYLVVLLENDQDVKRLKGENRPVFVQKERAEMLSSLRSVDLVVLLPTMQNDSDYLSLVKKIKPDIIAVTEGDRHIHKKNRQAKKVGATVRRVPVTKTFSTSTLAKILGLD